MTGNDYQTLVTLYASERFLYRLGISPVRDRFVLTGAVLLRVWSHQPYRSTRDLDLLHRGEGSHEAVRADIAAVLATEVEPDGLDFDAASIRIETIRPEDEFAGVRATMVVRCGTLRTTLQVDVGVGDAVWPPPSRSRIPSLLDLPEPDVLTYSPESVVAEKLEAIVVLGERNTRIKDFFDLRYLAEHHSFDRPTLAEAVKRTFRRRKTPVPAEEPFGLTDEYWDSLDRPIHVRAFARRAGLEVDPDTVATIHSVLRRFLLPILEDVRLGRKTPGKWTPPGPWR